MKIKDKLHEYHFEFKHITVLFFILFIFQIIISLINKTSISSFLSSTQEWYQKDSAERIANLTATSLELLIEAIDPKSTTNQTQIKRITQSLDIIFNQPQLQNNINDVCVLVSAGDSVIAIDNGKTLYSMLFDSSYIPAKPDNQHINAVTLYKNIQSQISQSEEIQSIVTDHGTFNIFVPLVLRGEYVGAVYLKNKPDFSFITQQIISNFDETSLLYLSLVLFGLLAMYFISSYTLKERDDAQALLFEEHETNIKKQINYEKEILFTKRIYHTHHKAEKVMGFIKEDIRSLTAENISEFKFRVLKYTNFISRVIYDMKWYDPPLQTIRNQLFRTSINEVIKFIVEHIFQRISSKSNAYEILLDLDEKLPVVPVNEFVVWEIIEPLIQNSIDHGGENYMRVLIKTEFLPELSISKISISDNGKGILPELLDTDDSGRKRIFLENVSSKDPHLQNVGYGCYIAYEIAKRCGWEVDAENLGQKGCIFTLTIKN